MHEDTKGVTDFDSLKLTLASTDVILDWSRGEVVKPETVNYRTQKPEKDGLFCEKIFGPSKDWECYCGKYKKIRYKGIVCDKCGVEVTRSLVRRERLGHIKLATPCSHIWFLRGVPSRIGLVLDLSLQNLEKVIYFANFVITRVDEDLKKSTLEQIKQEFKTKRKKIDDDYNRQVSMLKSQSEAKQDEVEVQLTNLRDLKKQHIEELEEVLQLAELELRELKPLKIISEHDYQDLSLKYGHIFEAGIGAEAVRKLLLEMNLEKAENEIEKKLETSQGLVKDKMVKRLRLIRDLLKNDVRPEWMILEAVPVIPPDLRPMVPLDGGRFATSDLNDLYRRIINRNNRLKQLIELNAPEVICRNEKRMLQEAVDALIDNNARHGKTVVASTGQKRMLKSLADILRGKQGRFRQNLLGKRIDYSGRSVIVVGPSLRLEECGLPKKMALELFKPFIISQLIKKEYVHNVRSASHFIDAKRPEIWDILEDIIKDAYVLLNRAPTLHRLGIQAFRPKLIEGNAIQVHPLVCSAFNADFDGDQMAVHVPLTEEAKWEAKNIILSTNNLLKPATGAPITNPGLDMVWGIYYLTDIKKPKAEQKIVSSIKEATILYQIGQLHLQDSFKIRANSLAKNVVDARGKKESGNTLVETSIGRIYFNQVLPKGHDYVNAVHDGGKLKNLVGEIIGGYTQDEAVTFLDKVKTLGFRYLTRSGHSWGMDDVPNIGARTKIIEQGQTDVEEIKDQFDLGLLTDSERHTKIIETWMKAKDEIVSISRNSLDSKGPIYTMVESGARGSWSQLIQIMGMKGLVTNPAGEIIELPVKGNFKKGFDVLEYFISTHGARKGLSDTALRTANAGYLTRRLVDVAQDLVVTTEDCNDESGFVITKKDTQQLNMTIANRIVNRYVLEDVVDGKKVILKKGEPVTLDLVAKIHSLDLAEIRVRSVMNCQTKKGVCQKCYGLDLGYNKLVKMGTAVGIIAAQSIGEPGTQLTMRTFHTGGVAGLDITQGLPRVEEIFEARIPRVKAFVTEYSGKVQIPEITTGKKDERGKIVEIVHKSIDKDNYPIKQSKAKTAKPVVIKVKDGSAVEKGDVLYTDFHGEKILAKRRGDVKVLEKEVVVVVEDETTTEYIIPREFYVKVKDGELIAAGDAITDGSLDLKQLYKLKTIEDVQRYVIREIQNIYTSQGQKLNDKHIELIAKKMFSRVYIKDSGDTNLAAGSRSEWANFVFENEEVKKRGGRVAEGDRLLLGITKVSLSTSSFLSAASFQETSRVLINAAISGQIDSLEGLKENVIIGRLIPAGTGYSKVAELGVKKDLEEARKTAPVVEGEGDGEEGNEEEIESETKDDSEQEKKEETEVVKASAGKEEKE